MPDPTTSSRSPLTRRHFLALGTGAALVSASTGCARANGRPTWSNLRVVDGIDDAVSRATLADAASLLRDAGAVVGPTASAVGPDSLLLTTNASAATTSAWRCASRAPGAYRLLSPPDGPAIVVCGADGEGARNGLYAWLASLGFGFFRDGETLPSLAREATVPPVGDHEVAPAFRWRGDMIWDNYLGPRRFCAAAWDDADWERALLFMARSGLNFLEFYPPMEAVFHRAFPEAVGLDHGAVWGSSAKEAIAQRALARGRELGIQFMYVIAYGALPDAVRALHPDLEWRGGFLCAHQPELRAFTTSVWRELVATFGTDHLYAIRHRGEEGQSYSDPCRSVTKADGFNQAFEVLRTVDPQATPTAWTWAEEIPDLFEALPDQIHAAHIRHGMGGMFDDVGIGREQADGRPDIPAGRVWLSGQFTVFSGADTLLQTAWSDGRSLARDARAATADPTCRGYFQWPEWSDTSPWLSEIIRRLAWDPGGFVQDLALEQFAAARHGPAADAFLAGFRPLLAAGNARVVATPRKRLLVPYFLAPDQLRLLIDTRSGLATMAAGGGRAAVPALFGRDLTDLTTWVALRQAHVLEAAASRAHAAGDAEATRRWLEAAEATWAALGRALASYPELSLVETARRIGTTAALSNRAVDSLWTLGCDFYNGYPLVLSPEAVELVYLEQTRALRRLLSASASPDPLDRPGWFWHDFPDLAWADRVRELPREDAARFEAVMRERFAAALGPASPPAATPTGGPIVAASPSDGDLGTRIGTVEALVGLELPTSSTLADT
ncbi:MAG: hypothetical protein CL471_06195 [Acidobacteria bacterium]|nr:hypothetical protein [Acidobacteriota bacterium]